MAKEKAQPEKRHTLNLNISAATRDQLRAFCEQTGRAQQHVAAKLVEWFTRQPVSIQRWVMGEPAGSPDEYSAALERAAAALKGK